MRCVVVVATLLAAACSSGTSSPSRPSPSATEPCGTEACEPNEVCYLDGRQPTSISNPSCQLAPAACLADLTCDCLVREVRMSVCDETEATIHVTLY